VSNSRRVRKLAGGCLPIPNVQIEMLKRLLASEINTIAKRNLIAERKFSEMLERAMRAYTNRSLSAAEIITKLVEPAKEMHRERDRSTTLGLRDDELAFYYMSAGTTRPSSSSATTRSRPSHATSSRWRPATR
jgi:type I site-specific restriction-modification system R (restriction) subunit